VSVVRTTLRVLAGIVVTVACLYFALRGSHWAEIRAVLGRTHYGWVLVMMGVSVLAVYLRALRWRILLEPVGRVTVRPLFSATAIGFMANMLLPLRAGEVIRPVLLGRQTTVSTSAAVASVVLERLLDMFLLFCFLLALSVAVPVPAAMQRASYIVAVVTIAILCGLVLLLRYRERAVARIHRALRRLPGSAGRSVSNVLESFIAGLAGINDGRTVAILVVYSVVVWVVIASVFGFGLLALDVSAPLAATSVSLVVLVAAFVSLPQAPGYVGTWQAGCVAALALYGVSREEAIGFSLVTHIIQVVVVVLLGGACLVADNVGLRELLSLAQGKEERKA
jgi:uncharacterized protein (TIRG00374 family)